MKRLIAALVALLLSWSIALVVAVEPTVGLLMWVSALL